MGPLFRYSHNVKREKKSTEPLFFMSRNVPSKAASLARVFVEYFTAWHSIARVTFTLFSQGSRTCRIMGRVTKLRCSFCLRFITLITDTYFLYYRFFLGFFLCLIGCFSMIVWTPIVFECLICMRFLFLYLHLFSATEHVSHGKAL